MDTLHDVMTFQVDQRVRRIATTMQDIPVCAKLAGGDMIATEAAYHRQCLSSYYNQARGLNKATGKSSEGILKGVALAELISHMEDQRVEGNKVVFKLSDLVFMYVNRLKELGAD